MLFSHLVEKAVDHPSGEVVMDYEHVKEIGLLFFRVLTQCRHRVKNLQIKFIETLFVMFL